jgi:large subunit ribosomal protein L15
MKLHEIQITEGSRKKAKRVGRGPGSGHGKQSCRGGKGLTARSGPHNRVGYEGGQMPKVRRMPKRGFRNTDFQCFTYEIVNLRDLAKVEAASINNEVLYQAGLIKHLDAKVKILAKGEFNKKVNVVADAFSESARQKIVALGGTAEVRAAQS